MKTEQTRWTQAGGWRPSKPGAELGEAADLVLAFGGTDLLKGSELLQQVEAAYPNADLLGCSTSGEICDTEVTDESLVATAVQFEGTKVKGILEKITAPSESKAVGESLGRALPKEGLAHVFVLSDGLRVNGSDLVAGLTGQLPPDITVTGGLSGDADRFSQTLVFLNSRPESGNVAALGLYGDRLRVGYGSLGGWDPFGPERLVTKSRGNVLYQLDGTSALELYKNYLGEHAEGLPATGLLFPLALRGKDQDRAVVRTILAVDDDAQSMTFAGDVPEGAYAQFMKANFDRLVDGAVGAARTSYEAIGSEPPDLAVLISCVGRKLVLKQRIEEEVEGVRDVLGERAALTGFYSYGEISPFTPGAKCELHNQTMTITTLSER